MKDFFEASAKYYDLLYEEKDSLQEAVYVDELLKKYGDNIQSILEFGLGTGRHAKEFINLGYDVSGIEISEKMIMRLDKIDNLTFKVGDIESTDFGKKFDSILSLFHVMSYQTENSRVLNVFQNAQKHLKKNGLFIFDVWYSPAVNSIKPSVRIKRFFDEKILITRIAEPKISPNKNLVDVNYNFFVNNKINNKLITFKELHPMRHFSIPEIELYASLANFQCLHCEEWLTKEKPSQNTWGICFVLKKND